MNRKRWQIKRGLCYAGTVSATVTLRIALSKIGNMAGNHDAAGLCVVLATTLQRLLTLLFGKQPVNSTHRHIINHVPCPSDKATTNVPSAYAPLLPECCAPVCRQSSGCWAQLATALPALLLARGALQRNAGCCAQNSHQAGFDARLHYQGLQ